MSNRSRSRARPALRVPALAALAVAFAVGSGSPSFGSARPTARAGCDGSWSRIRNPQFGSDQLSGVAASSSSDAWAVGSSGGSGHEHVVVQHWNGSAWSEVPAPSPAPRTALAGVAEIAPSDVWSVGFTQDVEQPIAEHWDGTSWTIVPTPGSSKVTFLYGVAGTGSDDVWAVGQYYPDFGVSSVLTMHWDGSNWSVVPAPNPSGAQAAGLSSVAALSPTDVWAVGSFTVPESGSLGSTLIEHWDGSAWTIVPSPNVDVYGSFLKGVAATSTGDVWAVGYYENAGLRGKTLVERWDGAAWTVVDSPNKGKSGTSVLSAVTAGTGGQAWAAGYHVTSYSGYSTLVERFDGSAWVLQHSANPGAGSFQLLNGIAVTSGGQGWTVGQVEEQSLIERACGL